MTPHVEAFFDPATYTYSYVVSDPGTGRCALVDSVLDYEAASGRTAFRSADRMIAYVRDTGLAVEWVLETHVHADHLTAAAYLRDTLGGRLAIGHRVTVVQETFAGIFNTGGEFASDGSQFDHLFADDEKFHVGALPACALYTPGHTPACVTYLIGDAAFVGDTLFMPDYGTARCDFPGGDPRALYSSVQRLFALPPTTRMFMCHDYGTPERREYLHETTVGEQRRGNVHVREGVDEATFIRMRQERDATLNTPALILPSVQVNMRAGTLPSPESNGTRYLRIPLNVF